MIFTCGQEEALLIIVKSTGLGVGKTHFKLQADIYLTALSLFSHL